MRRLTVRFGLAIGPADHRYTVRILPGEWGELRLQVKIGSAKTVFHAGGDAGAYPRLLECLGWQAVSMPLNPFCMARLTSFPGWQPSSRQFRR